MHTYRLLKDPDELDAILKPVLESNGSEVPACGQYVASVEFDEAGEVYAYQIVQTAVFLEGMWSRGDGAHLLRLYHMASGYIEQEFGVTPMTFTRDDEQGHRIGRAAERLGFKRKNWIVYRKET